MSDDTLALAPPAHIAVRLTEDQWHLVLRTYARGATPDEFALFRRVAELEELDPFRRMIHFVKRHRDPCPMGPAARKRGDRGDCSDCGGEVSFVAGVHGLVARLNDVAGFRGIVSAVVCRTDSFRCDPAGGIVSHSFGLARGPLVGAWARGQIGARAPIVRWVPIEEYRGQSPLWQSKPGTMIEKVAIAQCARALAPEALRELYAAEEFGGETAADGSVLLVAETTRASRAADTDAATIADALSTLEIVPDIESLEALLVGVRAQAAAWPPSARKLFKSHVERRRADLARPAIVAEAEIDVSAGEVREPGSDE